jgi:hypothetical protein
VRQVAVGIFMVVDCGKRSQWLTSEMKMSGRSVGCKFLGKVCSGPTVRVETHGFDKLLLRLRHQRNCRVSLPNSNKYAYPEDIKPNGSSPAQYNNTSHPPHFQPPNIYLRQ